MRLTRGLAVVTLSSALLPGLAANRVTSDRLQMLAFEAELARLLRSLILAIWESLDHPNQWHVTHAHSRLSLEEFRARLPRK